MSLLSQIFTWWNGQTIGTRFYTSRRGELVGEDDQGNRYPIVYEIDEFRCVFCGMCQEVCPVEAIHVGQHFENAEYTRDRFVYDLDRLMEQDHPTTLLWDPSDPRSE